MPMTVTLEDHNETRAYAGGGITALTGQTFSDTVKGNANTFQHAIKDGKCVSIEDLKWSCNLRHSPTPAHLKKKSRWQV